MGKDSIFVVKRGKKRKPTYIFCISNINTERSWKRTQTASSGRDWLEHGGGREDYILLCAFLYCLAGPNEHIG